MAKKASVKSRLGGKVVKAKAKAAVKKKQALGSTKKGGVTKKTAKGKGKVTKVMVVRRRK